MTLAHKLFVRLEELGLVKVYLSNTLQSIAIKTDDITSLDCKQLFKGRSYSYMVRLTFYYTNRFSKSDPYLYASLYIDSCMSDKELIAKKIDLEIEGIKFMYHDFIS